jgi:leader peptidase (prepilin peptidase)/N-methyltransferase
VILRSRRDNHADLPLRPRRGERLGQGPSRNGGVSVEADAAEDDIRADLRVIFAGTAMIAAVSALCLPWPLAALSTLLGGLMVAGADVDARCFLLPDLVTLGALACGLLAAAVMEPFSPWPAVAGALARGALTAGVLAAIREVHQRLSGIEGLGRGDVKLAAAIGAWLPAEMIPFCFAIATAAALAFVLLSRLRGQAIARTTRIPFGAFLCPALWLVFFASLVQP